MLNLLEQKAKDLDAQDPLKDLRKSFAVPQKIYFCSHSLGLPPAVLFDEMPKHLNMWSEFGAEGWFNEKCDWATFSDRRLLSPLSRLLGAKSSEVVVMNSLTINLHLMMTSFYHPTPQRYKILMDAPAFSSDLYAINSHLQLHGLDPEKALVILRPRRGNFCLSLDEIEQVLSQEGEQIALILLSPVNYLTGQALDMPKIIRLARQKQCFIGFDLAHAAGNVVLKLHEWGVDFAVGCSYKYLCAGPGSTGFAFVHERYHSTCLPRLSGWWGNDLQTRFQMQKKFIPSGDASGWQVSTPSMLSMIAFATSLQMYDQVGIESLRKKAELQALFLLELFDEISCKNLTLLTPRSLPERGCQTSFLIENFAECCLKELQKKNVICDFRPPNVIRVAPSPLYNTFYEIYKFACILSEILGGMKNE